MTPYYDRDGITIYHGDCREVAPSLGLTVSAVVTDPPYGLSFMGKGWDHGVPDCLTWGTLQSSCVPGSMLLAFGGTRTFHRLACAIEDAGYEIRDTIMWVYGSGFPKSLDVSKAIDKAAGVERQDSPEPATEAAHRWHGWGTALKPAWEPIIVARKPPEGTIAENVQKYGAGAINVDGCRVGTDEDQRRPSAGGENGLTGTSTFKIRARSVDEQPRHTGRFPANLIHDGSEEVVGLFPSDTKKSSGICKISSGTKRAPGWAETKGMNTPGRENTGVRDHGDSGSAARFFYTAKASPSDRGREEWDALPLFGDPAGEFRNEHPTVKPLALMRYLVTLVAHQDALILDPFMGSGTTLVAAKNLGRKAVGIEIEERYCEIAAKRLSQQVLGARP